MSQNLHFVCITCPALLKSKMKMGRDETRAHIPCVPATCQVQGTAPEFCVFLCSLLRTTGAQVHAYVPHRLQLNADGELHRDCPILRVYSVLFKAKYKPKTHKSSNL